MGNKIEGVFDARSIAREIARNNRGKGRVVDKRLIMPCDQLDENNLLCEFRNPSPDLNDKGLCRHPEGLIGVNGEVDCPFQRGGLRIVNGES